MSIKLVCDGCGKAEEYQQSYSDTMLTIPSGWASIVVDGPFIAVPAKETPNKFRKQLLLSHVNPARPIIGPKQCLVCSAECSRKVCKVIQLYLENIYRKRPSSSTTERCRRKAAS